MVLKETTSSPSIKESLKAFARFTVVKDLKGFIKDSIFLF